MKKLSKNNCPERMGRVLGLPCVNVKKSDNTELFDGRNMSLSVL
jgi:hypothetical protein